MNIQNLTDEELINMQVPPAELTEGLSDSDDLTPDLADEQDNEDESLKSDDELDDDGAAGDGEEKQESEDEDLSDEALNEQTAPPVEDKPKPATEEAPVVEAEKEKAPVAEKADEAKPTIDGAAEYAKLVGTPIKANGKEIVLKSTDEVLRLVQQGANYNKRMEELKPARKSAAMLESANLLGDEAALSHMIDLYNGKPEAIAKMVKDLNIDIYSLDLESGDKYTPTSHLQTDEAVNFNDTLKEVRSLEGGQEAMTLIDGWDRESQARVWGNATAVRQIYDYKQSGVYDIVATEVERRKTLGQIPPGTPFIDSFTQVGNELAAQAEAAATPTTEQQTPVVTEPAKPEARTPVATGPVPRKPQTPDARSAAAASPRKGVGAATSIPDIYSLSDADIIKMSAPPR